MTQLPGGPPAPSGPHRCRACPGGDLVEGPPGAHDPVIACFLECCSVKDEEHPEASRMLSAAEWRFFVQRVQERGLADQEDAGALAACPVPEPRVFSVRIERGGAGQPPVEVSRTSLEVVTLKEDGLGPLAAWNRARPAEAVRKGDHVVEAAGHREAPQIRQALDGGPGALELRLQRQGLNAYELQRHLLGRFRGEALRGFDHAAEAMRSAVHGANIAVGCRGLETLTQKELYTYQVCLGEYEHLVASELERAAAGAATKPPRRPPPSGAAPGAPAAVAASCFGPEAESAESSAAYGVDPGPLPTTPEEFQWQRGQEVERRLRELRVPAVAFPRGERVLERCAWGLRRLVGTATRTGEEVEVLEVPWDVPMAHAHLAEHVANHVEALKQLALSPYFLDYLGCDFSSHSGVGLHFLPLKRGVCLRKLVKDVGPMHEISPLFQFWAREILLGLRDYLYQCCQEVVSDLSLENVFTHQEGLQILLQHISFGGRRGSLMEDLPEYGPSCRWRNGFSAMESRLITMYGGILLELLYGEQDLDAPVPPLHELSPGLRLVISQALNARETFDYLAAAESVQDLHLEERPSEPVPTGVDALAEVDVGGALHWARRRPDARPILPNPERSMDAAGAPSRLAHDEGSGAAAAPSGQVAEQAIPQLRWQPNPEILTIQGLLNHPALQPQEGQSFPLLMDAWESYCGGRR